MEVHRELGCGFHERVYRRPFEIELSMKRVPFRSEVKYPVIYKGHQCRRSIELTLYVSRRFSSN
jgi:GxxExxY protein